MATTTSPATFTVVRSKERAFFGHAWLQTFHSFSFAEYVDPANMNWGALRVFNDDVIAGGQGFPPHPHRDMEIVTYVLAGKLAHQDSIGNRGVVGPGGVQFMSAGTGVKHSEFNDSKTDELHLVQMWVVPGQLGGAPAYGQMDFDIEARRNRWLYPVSGEAHVDAPIRITQKATFGVARIEDAMLVHEFQPRRYGFLFLADGVVEANGEKLRSGDAVRLYDVGRLAVQGHGEVVLWDLPALETRA